MATLADPLTLPGGLVLPNRIMKAALSEVLGDRRNAPDSRLLRLYTAWGGGGYGLIVTGNVMIDGTQLAEPGNVVIEDDRRPDRRHHRAVCQLCIDLRGSGFRRESGA